MQCSTSSQNSGWDLFEILKSAKAVYPLYSKDLSVFLLQEQSGMTSRFLLMSMLVFLQEYSTTGPYLTLTYSTGSTAITTDKQSGWPAWKSGHSPLGDRWFDSWDAPPCNKKGSAIISDVIMVCRDWVSRKCQWLLIHSCNLARM